MASKSKAASIRPLPVDLRAVKARVRQMASMSTSLAALGLGYGPPSKLDKKTTGTNFQEEKAVAKSPR
eukprot:2445463-Pyramimonas_sp.AAC.1